MGAINNIVRGDELFDAVFDPPLQVVEGMIVANTVWMLAGRPKSGKSWLLLNLVRALDTGEPWLGKPTNRTGRILYIALEDGFKRMHNRLHAMNWRPENVDFLFELDRKLDDGGDTIFSQLKESHGYTIFVLDTLRAALSPSADENDNNTMATLMNGLAKFSHNDEFTLIVSHHTRKSDNDGDSFEAIRGASALRGSYDGGAVLKRAHGERIARLELESRDMEVEDIMIEWNGPAGGWKLYGTCSDYQRDKRLRLREALVKAVREKPLLVDDAIEIVMSEMRMKRSTAQKEARAILDSLIADGLIKIEKRALVNLDGGEQRSKGRPKNVYVSSEREHDATE